MTYVEKLLKYFEQLPEEKKIEVIHFAEYQKLKSEIELDDNNDDDYQIELVLNAIKDILGINKVKRAI
ncbi:TPA: hypothetical protein KRM00_003752 [Clostridioides difficile]|uniref:Uncharacterized protein n=1 Tax=Clostridioides difficile TaxID=1496 RepID=A0AAN5VPS2_CLODI|nr:hypothetical protein [Clostridioides difficile]MDW0076963.1 hypothetical protein [Clostridioides difficile]CCL32418.1 conserved hypothetical protein [Clostridioides difficile E15]HBG4629310.1 hypothetical protein [Clostridioides difficile]HBG8471531.1 hypothetical protein [Clostridioides difficile]HBH1544208.1 hypothetical protein [Clostridioides difficile]